ncbi:MAG: hypothetical protein HY892_11900 [Deltaproteobacteria bacterium]|nr:hypothetical protein [Deltaproteobacteria bacterium]
MSNLEIYKKFRGRGSRIIWPLIQNFQDKLSNVFNVHERTMGEPAFWYNELQTKTFITLSLYKVSETVIQEYPIDRKRGHDNKITNRCRADFFFRHQNITFLTEFKQAWLYAYERQDSVTCSFGYVMKMHNSCVQQIKSFDSAISHTPDNLYAIALTMSPLFIKITKNTNVPELKNNKVDELMSAAKKYYFKKYKSSLSAIGFQKRKNSLIYSTEINGENQHQEYPGIFYFWTINKISRR